VTGGVAVVTGGSRGIGAATVATLARAGYAVVFSYLSAAEAAQRVCAAVRADGGVAIGIRADAADEAELAELFNVADWIGHLRLLVNNAATLGPLRRFADVDSAMLRTIVGTNLIGAMMCTQRAIARMSTQHGGAGGSIVNVSSGAARHGSPGTSVCYGATKAGLETMTVGLASELACDNIRVNAVAPGLIDTDMANPDALARPAEIVPMGRAGAPDEVAAAIAWLVSDQASYVSGAILRVSGGLA
jgi:NAD(P)-dependent dehydrogenase (short-subunit alcohol dehydrogenase family)